MARMQGTQASMLVGWLVVSITLQDILCAAGLRTIALVFELF